MYVRVVMALIQIEYIDIESSNKLPSRDTSIWLGCYFTCLLIHIHATYTMEK